MVNDILHIERSVLDGLGNTSSRSGSSSSSSRSGSSSSSTFTFKGPDGKEHTGLSKTQYDEYKRAETEYSRQYALYMQGKQSLPDWTQIVNNGRYKVYAVSTPDGKTDYYDITSASSLNSLIKVYNKDYALAYSNNVTPPDWSKYYVGQASSERTRIENEIAAKNAKSSTSTTSSGSSSGDSSTSNTTDTSNSSGSSSSSGSFDDDATNGDTEEKSGGGLLLPVIILAVGVFGAIVLTKSKPKKRR